MDAQTVKLYGYQAEREQVEAGIAERGTLRFLCVHGPGGIGKTTLLRAIYEAYRTSAAYCITDLLDFDDLRLHILQNILDEIAAQLSTPQAPFVGYFEAAARLREMQYEGASRLHIEDQVHRIREAFFRDCQALTEQRPILLFDTVEKVQSSALWQELVDLLLQLENTVVILAGQHNDEVAQELQEKSELPNIAQVISLRGLSQEEALDYFKRTELGRYLAAEYPEQMWVVCQLSDGRPILIDLAVDWLRQGLQLTLPDQPLDELDEESLRELQRQFERGLVRQINDLGMPRNEVILEMAHIYHYFDADRYCHLHDDASLEETQALFDELRSFSFVKSQPSGGLRLHDEIQRMVSEYVWPVLDRNRERRRWLSQCMVQFYEQHLAGYEDDPVMWQALVAEQLYHSLYADLKRGHRVFRPRFRQALSRHQIGFAQMLLNTLNEFSKEFDPELQAWSSIHKGRLLRAEEKVQEAVALIRPSKEKLQELRVHEQLDTVCNALGYCYRLMGDWEAAITAYEEALAYSREEKDVRQMAETMNNIANTCRLSGDFERANRYSLVGLKIREQLGDKRAIGNSCYVRGMVSWETGNTAEAADYIKRARALFEEADDLAGVADVDRYDAFMHFRTGDLEGALRSLKKAQKIFEEEGIGLGLADSLNMEARILIDRYAAEGQMDEGFRQIEGLAKRALGVAERIRDYYKIAECHLTLCRLYYRWGRYWKDKGDEARAREFQRLARERYDDPEGGRLARDHSYRALWRVYEWTMGDQAYLSGNWDEAFKHYVEECATAARYKRADLSRALNGLSDRLYRLPAERGSRDLTRHFCDYVIARWKQRGLAGDFPEVIEECEHIKTFLGLADPEHLERLRRWGADLLSRGEWQRAADVCRELLDAGQTHTPNEQVAWAMDQSARAYRQMGDLTQARRLCQQSLLIRHILDDATPIAKRRIASSRLTMSTIMWLVGSTNEATRFLRLARDSYEEEGDEVGVAHADRYAAFLYSRIGDLDQAQHYLSEAEDTFREKKLYAELGDALNLNAIGLRRRGSYEEARSLAHECRRLAEENAAYYTLAEVWLTLELNEYDAGRKALDEGKEAEAQKHFDRAKVFHSSGYPIAEQYGYDLLLSVYEGAAGRIAFAEGCYAAAFAHFVRDLEYGARYERARVRRELDRLVDSLVQLPERELIRFYADYIITEWQDRGLAEDEPDVPRLFQLLKEYREYV